MNFSVLLTVYTNDSPIWFKEALDSLVDQTLLPNEIVVVKDGPITSELELVLSEFSISSKVTVNVFALETNQGQGKALNYGLTKCQYKYVARMDSDDICRGNRFELQINYLINNPETDILSGFVNDFGNNGESLGIRSLPLTSEDIKTYAKLRSPFNHGCLIYNKDKVLEVGGYNYSVQVQDYKLWVDMLLNGCISSNIKDILLDVRVPDNYKRKSGLSYFKEEIYLGKYMYKKSFLNFFEFIRIIIIRAFPRLLPSSLLTNIYKRILRK